MVTFKHLNMLLKYWGHPRTRIETSQNNPASLKMNPTLNTNTINLYKSLGLDFACYKKASKDDTFVS